MTADLRPFQTWAEDGARSATDRAKISDEARRLFAGFEVIDPAARIPPPRRPATPYTSPDLGWTIDPGAPWIEWRSVRDRIPAAEYGALLSAAGFARPEVRRVQNLLERHCVVGWKA